MGTVPILDVGHACIPQSKSIERFVARKLGLLGIDPFEEALVDAVCELIRDMEKALDADESRHLISLPHLCMTQRAYSAFSAGLFPSNYPTRCSSSTVSLLVPAEGFVLGAPCLSPTSKCFNSSIRQFFASNMTHGILS